MRGYPYPTSSAASKSSVVSFQVHPSCPVNELGFTTRLWKLSSPAHYPALHPSYPSSQGNPSHIIARSCPWAPLAYWVRRIIFKQGSYCLYTTDFTAFPGFPSLLVTGILPGESVSDSGGESWSPAHQWSVSEIASSSLPTVLILICLESFFNMG